MKLVLGMTLFVSSSIVIQAQERLTENIILITLDGVRTEEIFGGLDVELFKAIDNEAESRAVFKKFYANSPEDRREKLMPFFWKTKFGLNGGTLG